MEFVDLPKVTSVDIVNTLSYRRVIRLSARVNNVLFAKYDKIVISKSIIKLFNFQLVQILMIWTSSWKHHRHKADIKVKFIDWKEYRTSHLKYFQRE